MIPAHATIKLSIILFLSFDQADKKKLAHILNLIGIALGIVRTYRLLIVEEEYHENRK